MPFLIQRITAFFYSKSFIFKLLLASVLFLTVTLPRFNRNSYLVKREMNDARYFKAYVEYFRGEIPSDVIRPASNWRLLVPLTASYLPFEALTALNMMNMLLLAGSIVILFASMRALKIDEPYCWLGVFLFICSFPTFYYTAIGYVDPGGMFFISAGIFAVLKRNMYLLTAAFAIGFLAKESVIILLPFAAVMTAYENKWKALGWGCLLIALYLTETYLVRNYAYVSPGELRHQFWKIESYRIIANLTRINSLMAPVLSFGFVGLIFIYALKKIHFAHLLKHPLVVATLASLLVSAVMYGFTFITTFADGRTIWLSYYAMIIASMSILHQQSVSVKTHLRS